jgi:ribosome-binding protein aMBF1 (putative translation factor)
MNKQFGYGCEFCSGTVKILEQVTIGVCDQCGSRYYAAETLKRVHAIASGKAKPTRTQRVPVAQAV